MNKRQYLKLVGTLLLYFVLCIPLISSSSVAEVYEQVEKAREVEGITGSVIFNDPSRVTNYSSSLPSPGNNLPNAAQACIDKKMQGEGLVKFLDSGVIRTLTGVVEVMTAICTMYQTVSAILDNMLIIAKGVCVVQTCVEYVNPVMISVCQGVESVVTGWKAATLPLSLICCFVNCGFVPWCSGHSCWDQLGNLGGAINAPKAGQPEKAPSSATEASPQQEVVGPPQVGEPPQATQPPPTSNVILDITGFAAQESSVRGEISRRWNAAMYNVFDKTKFQQRSAFFKEPQTPPPYSVAMINYKQNVENLKAVYADQKITDIAYPEGVGSAALGTIQGHLRAYDNIYTAIACLCPTAILVNLKKLRTIYQVYNCCVEEACESGQSTEHCERSLSEQTCMYWEGSLLQSLVGMLMGILQMLVSKIIFALIAKYLTFLVPILNCLVAVYELIQIPQEIRQLGETWDILRQSDFHKVSCDDLDTSRVAEFQPNLRERYEDVKILDFDFEEWQRKKQEVENSRFSTLQGEEPNAISLPSPLIARAEPLDPEPARAKMTIIFPRKLGKKPDAMPPPIQVSPTPVISSTQSPTPTLVEVEQ